MTVTMTIRTPFCPDLAVLIVDAAPLVRPFTRDDDARPLARPEFLSCDDLSTRLGLPVVAMWAIASDCGEGYRPGLDATRDDDVRDAIAQLREMFAQAPEGIRTDDQLVAWTRAQLQTIRERLDMFEASLTANPVSNHLASDIWVAARNLADVTTLVADQISDCAHGEPSVDDTTHR